jgi:6-phosphogluconolactonase
MRWIYEDLESLSQACAGIFVRQARQAVQAGGRFSVALSGGHTPRRTYELLAQDPLRGRVPWEQVHVFWGDERCVPPDDPESNERMARRALLDHVPIPATQVHPIRCAQAPGEAAGQYEALLRSFLSGGQSHLDLVLLGLGENGHTASLFPGTAVLAERDRWVADVYVAEQDKHRVTLTAPIFNQAAVVVFLVAGAAKAPVLQKVLDGAQDSHMLPAKLIQPASGALYWLLDEEASGLLKREA